MYARFVLPYEQEIAAELRRLGALSVLHICGNTTPMLKEMAACGTDGCDVDHLTDWPGAVRVIGSRMAVKGNVNPLLLLPGNQEELAEACERAIRGAGACPGFILSSGCLVPRDTDPASFEVFARAASRRSPVA